MPEKYIVNLKTEEREYLHQLTQKGKCPARVFKRAHILLLADEGHATEIPGETFSELSRGAGADGPL